MQHDRAAERAGTGFLHRTFQRRPACAVRRDGAAVPAGRRGGRLQPESRPALCADRPVDGFVERVGDQQPAAVYAGEGGGNDDGRKKRRIVGDPVERLRDRFTSDYRPGFQPRLRIGLRGRFRSRLSGGRRR